MKPTKKNDQDIVRGIIDTRKISKTKNFVTRLPVTYMSNRDYKQWLTLDEWSWVFNNDPKLTMGQQNSREKNDIEPLKKDNKIMRKMNPMQQKSIPIQGMN